jgi:hypothetical protein
VRAVCLVHDASFCAAADNAMFYARNGVPFVLGTTGGDRQTMMQQVVDSGVYAVIAPQMGKQVCSHPPGTLPFGINRSRHDYMSNVLHSRLGKQQPWVVLESEGYWDVIKIQRDTTSTRLVWLLHIHTQCLLLLMASLPARMTPSPL